MFDILSSEITSTYVATGKSVRDFMSSLPGLSAAFCSVVVACTVGKLQ